MLTRLTPLILQCHVTPKRLQACPGFVFFTRSPVSIFTSALDFPASFVMVWPVVPEVSYVALLPKLLGELIELIFGFRDQAAPDDCHYMLP